MDWVRSGPPDRHRGAANIKLGALGPHLEDEPRPHGLTLRHFSGNVRRHSGGWIATRSGGHYATNDTHIDDFVESVRVLTPRGRRQLCRLPGSGAGPSPDRMMIGSEGILGVITSAWMRVERRPAFRATAGVTFADWAAGVMPRATSCRRSCGRRTCASSTRPKAQRGPAGLDGTQALVIISFESAELSQRHNITQAVELAEACGGEIYDDDVHVSDGSGEPTGSRAGPWAPGATPSSASATVSYEPGFGGRHLRDGHHVGPLGGVLRARAGARRLPARGVRPRAPAVAPVHPRLPRRTGAVLHVVGSWSPRFGRS